MQIMPIEGANYNLTPAKGRNAVLTVNGIVTRYANYRDNDRMLTILTDEQGLISAAARGCRKQNSPLLGASELFVYGEFVIFERQGRSTVDSCDVRESFYPLRQDMDRFSAGMHMLELANCCAGQGQRGGDLMRLLYYSLSYLAYTAQNPLDAALCCTIKSLSLVGYTPSLTNCAACGRDVRRLGEIRFDAEAGGAVCARCAGQGAEEISPLALEAARRMILLSGEDVKKVALPQGVRRELRAALGAYARSIMERPFKALDQIEIV